MRGIVKGFLFLAHLFGLANARFTSKFGAGSSGFGHDCSLLFLRCIPGSADIRSAAVAFPLRQRQVELELERRVHFFRSELAHLSSMQGEGARANLGLGSTGPVVVDYLEMRTDVAVPQLLDLGKVVELLVEPNPPLVHRRDPVAVEEPDIAGLPGAYLPLLRQPVDDSPGPAAEHN